MACVTMITCDTDNTAADDCAAYENLFAGCMVSAVMNFVPSPDSNSFLSSVLMRNGPFCVDDQVVETSNRVC